MVSQKLLMNHASFGPFQILLDNYAKHFSCTLNRQCLYNLAIVVKSIIRSVLSNPLKTLIYLMSGVSKSSKASFIPNILQAFNRFLKYLYFTMYVSVPLVYQYNHLYI